MSEWLLQIPTLSLSDTGKEESTNKTTSFANSIIQTAINDADSTFKKLLNQNRVSVDEEEPEYGGLNRTQSKAAVESQVKENLEQMVQQSSTESSLEMIKDLDNLPIFLGNDLKNRYDVTSELINSMIDSIVLKNRLPLSYAIDMLKTVAQALKVFDTLTSIDMANIITSNMCSYAPSRSTPPECFFLPLFLLGLNLSFYIKNAPKKKTTYKEAKENALLKKKNKEKSEKEHLFNFAAAFEFGIS